MKIHFPLPKLLLSLIIITGSLTIPSNQAFAHYESSLTANTQYIPADGISTSTITITINHMGNPISGATVNFGKYSPNGTITPSSTGTYDEYTHTITDTTNTSGQAWITFKSDVPEKVRIWARYYDPNGGLGWVERNIDIYVVGVTQNSPLWWFNGENATYYLEAVTLTVEGATTGTFSWTVTSGTDKVNLENDQDSIILTNDNTVYIKSTSASVNPDDVTISLTINGWYIGQYSLSVYAPTYASLISGPNDNDYGAGFWTVYGFKVLDQFDTVLPYPVEFNEDFGQWTSDFVNEDWSLPIPNGLIIDPATFYENYAANYQLQTPTPVNPGAPGSDTKVKHTTQYYRIGSVANGSGRLIKVHTFQYYRGKGRQE